MSRRAFKNAMIAVAATLAIAAAGASAAAPPSKLTHKYPLGTQTLSHSTSKPPPQRSGPAPAQPGTAPNQPPATTQPRPAATPRTHTRHDHHRILVAIGLAAAVLVYICADRRLSRRDANRREHTPPLAVHRPRK